MLLPVMLSNGADLTVENEVREPSCLGQLVAPYGSFGASSDEGGERDYLRTKRGREIVIAIMQIILTEYSTNALSPTRVRKPSFE
jgi:hypothetical protein